MIERGKKINSQKKFILNSITILLAFIIAYIFIKYIFFIFMPFILSVIIANMIKPIANKLRKTMNINYKISATLCIISFYILMIYVFFIIIKLTNKELHSLIETFNLENGSIDINQYIILFKEKFLFSNETEIGFLNEYIISGISELLKQILNIFSLIILSAPKIIAFSICTIVSSIIITIDYYKISSGFQNILNNNQFIFLRKIKNLTFKNLKNMVKAQFILMFYTFIFLMISFLIIKFPYFIIMSIIIAVLDFFPIIGTGIVFIPWILYENFLGNPQMSIKLLIIYFILNFIRNIIEPKIISSQINTHPIVNITSMYIGAATMGAFGLIAFPILTIILIDIIKENKIDVS